MMNNSPTHLEVNVDSVSDLAVDCWRLEKWLSSKPDDQSLVVPKHVLRRLVRFLNSADVHITDLTGQSYDPGLAVEVVDSVTDKDLKLGEAVIIETISPIVFFQGRAIRHGQIAIKQGDTIAETIEGAN